MVKKSGAVRRVNSCEASASALLRPVGNPLPNALGLLGADVFREVLSVLKALQLLLGTLLHQDLQVVPDLAKVRGREDGSSRRTVT